MAGGLQQLLPDDVPGALADKLDLLKGFSAVLVERPSSETLGEGFGRAIADAWKRINPDSSPEVAELAAKAAGLAGVASREVGTLLDRLRGDAVRNGATPGEVLGVIDAVKQQAFSVYRGALAGISEGLYRITDPEELVATATQRLDAVQEDFLSGAPTPVDVNVAAGETEPLLVSLVGNDWLMKAGAGTLVVNGANTHAGGTFVAAGTLIVSNAEAFGTGPLIVAGGATVVLDVGSQTVLLGGLTLAEGARLDLGEARLEITSIGVQAESLRSWIIAGRAGGTWAGAEGIGSRAAAASPVSQAVGYLVRADRSATVAFTLAGDLDLDVDAFDRVQLLTQGHYGAGTAAEWAAGDLNYDGVVNAFDLIAMAAAGVGRRVDAQPALMATQGPATNGQLQVFRSLAAGISWGHVAATETATETRPRRVFRLV